MKVNYLIFYLPRLRSNREFKNSNLLVLTSLFKIIFLQAVFPYKFGKESAGYFLFISFIFLTNFTRKQHHKVIEHYPLDYKIIFKKICPKGYTIYSKSVTFSFSFKIKPFVAKSSSFWKCKERGYVMHQLIKLINSDYHHLLILIKYQW